MEFGEWARPWRAHCFVDVAQGLSLCHIAINVMKVWQNELKTSVNVINVTFYLG